MVLVVPKYWGARQTRNNEITKTSVLSRVTVELFPWWSEALYSMSKLLKCFQYRSSSLRCTWIIFISGMERCYLFLIYLPRLPLLKLQYSWNLLLITFNAVFEEDYADIVIRKGVVVSILECRRVLNAGRASSWEKFAACLQFISDSFRRLLRCFRTFRSFERCSNAIFSF